MPHRPACFALAIAVTLGLSFQIVDSPSANADSTNGSTDLKSRFARPETIPFPEDNPFSDAKAELGKILYFDPRLSGDNSMSCATCHNPALGWEDGLDRSLGVPGERLGRHSPSIENLAWGELFFWDGRAASLEEQAKGPIASDMEMVQDYDELVAELKTIPAYQAKFEAVFPGEGITIDTIAMAIATFERTVVSPPAPFDRWLAGDEDAISEAAKRGFIAFNGEAGCVDCHDGWRFTDDGFHDIGISDSDMGRYEQLPIAAMRHAFKTPGLRNIATRAPYMHTGSMATLEEVVVHYAEGFEKRESLSSSVKPFSLEGTIKQDLVAFMESLTSEPETTIRTPQIP